MQVVQISYSSSEDSPHYLPPHPPESYQEQTIDHYSHNNHGREGSYPHYPMTNDRLEKNPDRTSSSSSSSYYDDIDYTKIMGLDTPVKIRHAFIKKTFSLIGLSLAWAFGICLTINLIPEARKWIKDAPWLILIACCGMLAISMLIICKPRLGQKVPWNILLLMGYSTCTGLCIAAVGAYTDVLDTLVPCIATTLVICACCIAFAFQTKKDFTQAKFLIMIMTGLIAMLFFGLIGWFIHLPALSILYGCIGVLIFSFLLIIDVQMIVGGNRSMQYSIDDYCIAALSVHADVINIFLYLLRIMGAMEG